MSKLFPVYPRLDLSVVGASGTRLFTEDGRSILDLYGAHAVCPLGHAHPALTEALSTGHRTLDFYSNSLHMPVQERAAEAVLRGQDHLGFVHFVNSGTEANEAAIHLARRLTGRSTIVTLEQSFHGRTLGALTVTGLAGYRARVPVDVPDDWHRMLTLDDLAAIEAVVTDDVAAVLLEGVPSLGGVRMPEPAWLAALQARCRAVGAMLIVDEVQAGVGRLGTWFGHQTLGLQPDMVTLAKSLGGGFPVGALVTTPAVAEAVSYGELGTTFGGGPLAAVMVKTVSDVIHDDGLMDRVGAIFDRVHAGLADLDGVEVRGAGALIGIETAHTAKELRSALLEHDILIGVSAHSHTARLLLPYVVSDDDLDTFLHAAREVLGG